MHGYRRIQASPSEKLSTFNTASELFLCYESPKALHLSREGDA